MSKNVIMYEGGNNDEQSKKQLFGVSSNVETPIYYMFRKKE